MDITKQIAEELHITYEQVANTIALMDEGATIPFIARYRKEVTDSLDDNQLRELETRLHYLRGLQKRKEEVCASIEAQEKMTPELAQSIACASTLVEVEDLYRPYKQKRKTRASMAREKGLAPLAVLLLEQNPAMPAPLQAAELYISDEKGVETAQDALNGAMDILAEDFSDNAAIRKQLRAYFLREGVIVTSGTTQEDSVYSMYYTYSEPCRTIPAHRILAINRGEREGFLKVSVSVDTERCQGMLYQQILLGESPARPCIVAAVNDSFSRLIYPSLENEIRALLTEQSADSAIKVFAENLHQLLMQPPVKDRVVLGLDPAYRTGCKIAVVDATGKVLYTTVVYPTPPQNKLEEAAKTLKACIAQYGVNLISIGNGTASKESELFVVQLIRDLPDAHLHYLVVSEAGASVYSASKLAAEEFPEFDVSLRSAVSIARRLQDPLAELVKIDPKAIGVGQYQHDMPKNKLDASLGGVVEACVNKVGVDLNTASHSLLGYISGINQTVAKNIVAFRNEHGQFSSRRQLLKVPKLGPKAFEQCAGFLRIKDGTSVFDNTAVHPESYQAAKILLEQCGFTTTDATLGNLETLKQKAEQVGFSTIAEAAGVGVPTLLDMIDELMKPGRDPRDALPAPLLRSDILSMEDLAPDMILEGTVRNIVDFGAFVDIGVHQDGLVHISQLSDRYIKHPLDAVKLGDIVKVKVLSVDPSKKRIALTMKGLLPA